MLVWSLSIKGGIKLLVAQIITGLVIFFLRDQKGSKQYNKQRIAFSDL